MKNKVMGKALSWVLSAAMALTMSGAIPAMTITVGCAANETDVKSSDYYLPSWYEYSKLADTLKTVGNFVWTRDNISSTDTNASNYAAAAQYTNTSSAATSATTQLKTAYNYYTPIVNINFSDRTKTLFAKLTGTQYALTIIPTGTDAITAPSAKSFTDAATSAQVVLNSAIGTGLSIGWFTTTGAAYTSSSAVLSDKGTATIANDKLTVTLSNIESLANKYVYIYTYKLAGDGTTIFASAPQLLNAGVDPTAANFKLSSSASTAFNYGTAVTAGSIVSVLAPQDYDATNKTVGDQVGGDSTWSYGTDFKNMYLMQGTNTYKPDSSNSFSTTLAAGDYDVYADVAKGTGNETTGTKTNFNDKTAVKLCTITINKKALTLSNSTITLPSVAQKASKTYSIAKLAMTAANGVLTADVGNVNALNVKVVAASTDTPGSTTATVTFATVDNANYTIANGGAVVTSVLLTVVAAKVKSATIKTDATQLYYKEGNTFNPAGMVVTLTYETGDTVDVAYEASKFSFSPALSTNLVSTLSPYTFNVSYIDAANSNAKVSAGTQTVTAYADDIALTSIKVQPSTVTLAVGEKYTPTITYLPYNATVKGTLSFLSGTATTATVDSATGLIEAKAIGTTVITVTDTISGVTKTATLNVTVADKSLSVEYKRLSGDDRYATAAAIAKEAYSGATPDSVVLVSGESFADALTAAGYAGAKEEPLLITATAGLSSETASLLTTWKTANVTIIGGPKAVSSQVEADLTKLGIKSNRIEGTDRYETARLVYLAGVGSWMPTNGIFIATGMKAADALSASAIAYSKKMPIFLAGADGSLDNTSLAIAKTATKVYILGGTSVISSATETTLKAAVTGTDAVKRLAGDTRYDTSAAIAKEFATAQLLNKVTYASGLDSHFPDALVGGMLAGKNNVPLLLVDGTSGAGFDYTKNTVSLKTSSCKDIYFLGGIKSVTAETVAAITGNWSSAKEVTSFTA
jgi:putative cell wall-binding protein